MRLWAPRGHTACLKFTLSIQNSGTQYISADESETQRLRFLIFSKEKKNIITIDSKPWRVQEMLRWQFSESWTSCLPAPQAA